MTEFPTVRVAAVQATPVILDAAACVEKAIAAARGGGRARRAARRAAGDVRAAVPLQRVGAAAPSAFGGWDELWERLWAESVDVPGPLVAELEAACARLGVWCAIGVNEREARPPGLALQHAAADRAGGARAQAPQADADPARAAVPRHRRGPRPRRGRDRHGPRRRADLLGEPDAAGALRRLPRRAADLGRADRRRLRRLARLDAPHRDRVGRVRGLGAAVHPGRGVPRRLPGADRARARLRARRRGDRRAGRAAA